MFGFMETQKVSLRSRITLPHEFAGKIVLIERIGDGVINIRIRQENDLAEFEQSLHTAEYQTRLREFEQWLEHHQPEESDIEELAKRKLA